MNLKKIYDFFAKKSWPYIIGAILLSITQILTLTYTNNPWGISRTFADWGAWIYRAIGGNIDSWYYFSNEGAQATLNSGFFNDPGSIRNVGIIVGALLASLLASQFRIRKIKSLTHIIAAVSGGLLMGYGARISFGCNIGALYSGISSLSASGWVFGLFLFLGAIVGSKLLIKFFI